MNIMLAALTSAGALLGASAWQYAHCTQEHPGRQHRVESVTKRGDSRMTLSVAGHTVLYAKERYHLQDIVTPDDYDRAVQEVKEYFTWTYGNSSLVSAQFVSAGYQHFDSHADEAAAALLGMTLPGPGAQVRLPKELSDWLKQRVDSLSSDGSDAELCQGMDSTIVGFACEVLMPFVREAIKRSIDRIGISSAALIGQNHFDISDQQIKLLIHTRRYPITYTLKKTPRKAVVRKPGDLR